MSNAISQQLSSLIRTYQQQLILRLEGIAQETNRDEYEDFLNSGYSLQLDLQHLNKNQKKRIWETLTDQTEITFLKRNPFCYRGTEDQFGQLHEEYHTSWLDFSGNIWSYISNLWYKQAYISNDNLFHIFRTTLNPDLIMIKYIGKKKQFLNPKPKKNKNVISLQFFSQQINQYEAFNTCNNADEYHREACKRDHLIKLKQSSLAVILSLLIWFMFQYPPSSAFFIGLLASLGIPFFSLNLTLLGVLSLLSIFVAIGINFLCDLSSSQSNRVIQMQSINKILYQICFFVIPLILILSSTLIALKYSLLPLACIAVVFALYHYLCLNEDFLHKKELISIYTRGLFKGRSGKSNDATNHTANTSNIELAEIKKDTPQPV